MRFTVREGARAAPWHAIDQRALNHGMRFIVRGGHAVGVRVGVPYVSSPALR